jgi:hypothetical protein
MYIDLDLSQKRFDCLDRVDGRGSTEWKLKELIVRVIKGGSPCRAVGGWQAWIETTDLYISHP